MPLRVRTYCTYICQREILTGVLVSWLCLALLKAHGFWVGFNDSAHLGRFRALRTFRCFGAFVLLLVFRFSVALIQPLLQFFVEVVFRCCMNTRMFQSESLLSVRAEYSNSR